MSEQDHSAGMSKGAVDFGRLGDWTSWSSLLVLLLLAPLTALCLAPFVAVAAAVLPGGFDLWMILYFAALPLLFVPGLGFLQVRLVCPESRKPTADELARLMPLWDSVLAEWARARGGATGSGCPRTIESTRPPAEAAW